MGKLLLNLDLFTKPQSDMESTQYKILGALKAISEDFRKNKIYPHLSHLVELHAALSDIRDRLHHLQNKFPKRIKKVDFVNETIEHEVVFVPGSDISKVEDLIEWALPYIRAKIEEGKTIYQFVDDELKIEEVGIIPRYTDEGYLFIPDNQASRLLLYQYEVSIFESSSDTYRSLKTAFLKAVDNDRTDLTPNAIKLDLINERRELPNPATFALNTDLQLPYKETIFPITKRKLMQQLHN